MARRDHLEPLRGPLRTQISITDIYIYHNKRISRTSNDSESGPSQCKDDNKTVHIASKSN